VVYDGPAAGVDHAVLTRIYGDEDWTAITQRMDGQRAGTRRRGKLALVGGMSARPRAPAPGAAPPFIATPGCAGRCMAGALVYLVLGHRPRWR
jgi:hypothetical protein